MEQKFEVLAISVSQCIKAPRLRYNQKSTVNIFLVLFALRAPLLSGVSVIHGVPL